MGYWMAQGVERGALLVERKNINAGFRKVWTVYPMAEEGEDVVEHIKSSFPWDSLHVEDYYSAGDDDEDTPGLIVKNTDDGSIVKVKDIPAYVIALMAIYETWENNGDL
jgi:hypothetical protein